MERMFNLLLNNDPLHNEWQTILYIAKNNIFTTTLLHKLKHQIQHRIMQLNPHENWKYHKVGNLHIYLPTHTKSTNLFQKTNVKIAFRFNYNTARLTKPTNVHKIPPHNKWKFTNQPATPATLHIWPKPAAA
jgi:hypothetical protein